MVRLTVLLLWATAAHAEAPMSETAFDAYVSGRTLSFSSPLLPEFGVEHYLPDRRVIWSPPDGSCIDGRWFAKGDDICFLYDGDDEAKCWHVFKTPQGLRVEFTNRPGTLTLFEDRGAPRPLVCPDLLF